MKLLYSIRGANTGWICLADLEAQGSAVRQSLCADCQARANIQTDEGGAMEFYTRGAKLFLTKTNDGKIDLGETEKVVAQQVELHGHLMRAIASHRRRSSGPCTRRMKLRRLAPLRGRTECCFIWTARALPMPLHRLAARRKRPLGKRA